VQEDRDRQREQRKKRDVQNRAASGRHADMVRRMSQTAQLPGHSEHLPVHPNPSSNSTPHPHAEPEPEPEPEP